MTNYKRYRGMIPTKDAGTAYTVTLEREDAAIGDPIRELHFYGEGFILEREAQESLFSPLLPTRLTLYLMSDINYRFEHIAKDSAEWTVRLGLGNKTLFAGRIETGLYEEDFAEPPYEVRLVATCGLQSLYDKKIESDRLPVNTYGVTTAADLIRHLVMQATRLPLRMEGTAPLDLGTLYVDPSAYDAGSDHPLTVGDVLEKLLHDLCLTLRQEEGSFVLRSAIDNPPSAVQTLGSAGFPLYATPQLQSDRGIGQLMLSLPTEEAVTIAPYGLPTNPVPVVALPDTPFSASGKAYLPPTRKLAVTPASTANAPSKEEYEKGITLKSFRSGSSFTPDEQGILIAFPIDDFFARYPIEVTVPMRLKNGADKVTPTEGEVQNCLDAWLCHYNEADGSAQVCYQASIGDVYRLPSVQDPLGYRNAVYEESTLHYYKDSVAGAAPNDKSTAGWTDCRMAHNVITDDIRTSRYTSFGEELSSNRNYAKVRVQELYSKESFALFRYAFLPPLRHIMRYHNERRTARGEAPKPEPNYVLLRIPFFFWLYDTDGQSGKKRSTRIYADEIQLGQVTVKYRSEEDKDHPYTAWLSADRATSWLRSRDESLTYATLEPNLVQPPSLRFRFLNEKGVPLTALCTRGNKPVTLAEYFSEQYMRGYARPCDTITATVGSDSYPFFLLSKRFRIKGRPGKTYRVAGSVFHPSEGASEELTLIECPPARAENTSFVIN